MNKTRYAVVRIDNGPTNPPTGVVSNHYLESTAIAAIARANHKLRMQPGYQTAWHPYVVLDRKTGVVTLTGYAKQVCPHGYFDSTDCRRCTPPKDGYCVECGTHDPSPDRSRHDCPADIARD